MEHSDKVRIRPFVFEAMGVYYSTIGFNLTDLEDLERVLVNIVAKTDPVPMMDLQEGTTRTYPGHGAPPWRHRRPG